MSKNSSSSSSFASASISASQDYYYASQARFGFYPPYHTSIGLRRLGLEAHGTQVDSVTTVMASNTISISSPYFECGSQSVFSAPPLEQPNEDEDDNDPTGSIHPATPLQAEFRKGGDAHLIREIEALKAKLEELETDCNELSDENLELLLKIKETNGGIAELEAEVTIVVNELAQKRTDIQTLETTMQSKEVEIMELRLNRSKLEVKCKSLRREITELQATNETLIEECNSIKQLAEELRKEKSQLEEHCANPEDKLRGFYITDTV
ncbi:hypothetical protein F3Y22_tig00110904pilonHSYRG00055 [Hibiscus syriacus]|uniref:Uncharacterized protein n=1 Tax=Hibiscus syriacus TaxID=106335 RepID=A0A6A2ZGZ4_HIBSY|nr:hypothetical protein F3Y22_tig00110904pilonHSYRG00055 [Hibiscus syriacus]